jgi:hypothetical protein
MHLVDAVVRSSVSSYAKPMVDTVRQRRFGEGRTPAKRSDPGQGVVAVLNFVAKGNARAIAFLILCSLLFYLPGFFTIPAVDRD